MLGTLIAGVGSGQIGTGAAVAAVAVSVFVISRQSSRDRRKEKRIIANKDKTAMEEVRDGVNKLISVTFDRPPSDVEPDGHRGLVSVVNDHSKILARLDANGGNTDNPGDLTLKMARKMGVTEEQT